MKVLVMPDVHGSWNQALKIIEENKDKVDKVVTLGDYVDDWEEASNGLQMISGFKNLVKMARAEPDKFEILIGNHDNSYISDRAGSNCSGHHWQYAADYREMFENNIDIIKAAVEIDGVIFSHAGLTEEWWAQIQKNRFYKYHEGCPEELAKKYDELCYNKDNIFEVYFDGDIFNLLDTSKNKEKIEKYKETLYKLQDEVNELEVELQKYYKEENLTVEKLNEAWRGNHSVLNHCGWESSGDSIGESPIWIRPSALIQSTFPKCKYQVVGHTETRYTKPLFTSYGNNKIIICDNYDHSCWFILDTEKEYEFDSIEEYY